MTGRGGTSFAPVMEFLDEHRDYDGTIRPWAKEGGGAPVVLLQGGRLSSIAALTDGRLVH